jgi:oligosaccharide reducing-end xylanase
MLIALQLGHREEHDRLWRFAAESMRYREGPNRGYLRSSCTDGPCADPYGQQVVATALLLAHGRWGSRSGDIDYGAEALALLHAMRHRPSDGGDVTAMIDATSQLPVDEPRGEAALRTRPANVMPAFYELWAQATADGSWKDVADASRALLQAAAHPGSGLWPLRAEFDGSAVAGADAFVPEGYRVLLNMGLDHAWFQPTPWYAEESDRLVDFFSGEGLELYGSSYELDGSACIGCGRNMGLVALNGVGALPASSAERIAFFDAVWNLRLTEGQFRYYDGLLHMLSLLVLSGQLRIY